MMYFAAKTLIIFTTICLLLFGLGEAFIRFGAMAAVVLLFFAPLLIVSAVIASSVD